jgi:SAM-dependent methyltransferase
MKPLLTIEPHGYRRLAKIPPRDELEAFYRVSYPALLASGERVINKPDLWLQSTVWADILSSLKAVGIGKDAAIFDVGTGDGALPEYLRSKGFDAQGLDIAAPNACSFQSLVAAVRQIEAENPGSGAASCLDAILMAHYLAHDPDPVLAIRDAHSILKKGGMIYIRTGNDFNPLQMQAAEKHGEYWVNSPDIINYFSSKSLCALLQDNGFTIFDTWNDFPIEALLLDGLDYVNDKEAGALAHRVRVDHEMNMSPQLRRTINRAYAKMGIGRCCHVVALKNL